MSPIALLVLLAGLGLIAYALSSSQGATAVESVASDVEAAVQGWQNVNEGPTWVPVINQTETSLGIPANLLARMAFQESSFLPDVIDGTVPSSAGALGILQLMPQYNTSVQVPVPFSTSDTQAQITQAGQDLLSLYNQFNDWGVAVAAYNAGAGTIAAVLAGTQSMPSETSNYVADILADVPVPTQLTTA
jgi:soluble lytic murein transglycosylase-like protein